MLTRFFKRFFKKPELDPGAQMMVDMRDKGCPECQDHPMTLLQGLSAGLSENVFCDNCGTRFCIHLIPGQPRAEIIKVRELQRHA